MQEKIQSVSFNSIIYVLYYNYRTVVTLGVACAYIHTKLTRPVQMSDELKQTCDVEISLHTEDDSPTPLRRYMYVNSMYIDTLTILLHGSL